jgi:hypothetical protein
MILDSLSLSEKIELAIVSTEQTLIELLLLSPEMLVRRAMLRNNNITTDIVNLLTYDVTENVSYMASKHMKCTLQRTFDLPVSMCVQCKVDERKLSCDKCPYL